MGGSWGAAVAETHSATVVFLGDRAYKVKKPVDLGFLDFRTVEARRDDLAHHVGVALDLSPDDEEGRLRPPRGEQAQHLPGRLGVGPVVERERDAPLPAREPRDQIGINPEPREERAERGPGREREQEPDRHPHRWWPDREGARREPERSEAQDPEE